MSTLMLMVVLRTWLVMGLIEPLTVAGSSMAHTLRGTHIELQCPNCGNRFDIDADLQTREVECTRCGYSKNSVEGLPVKQGDSLIVDRTALEFRTPRRWEPVVFHSPDRGELTVKRVVGLPGETVQLRDGDVWIDGQVATKLLADLRAARQLIHAESTELRRWQADDEAGCRWHSSAWHVVAHDGAEHGLYYVHPGNAPITNDCAYNANLSRRVFPVRDFALSVRIRSPGDWYVILGFDNGGDKLAWNLADTGERLLEFFAFDRRVQIFLDGRLYEESELESAPSIKPTSRPFFLGVRDSYVEFRDLRIYHDIYHASEAEQIGSLAPMQPVELGSAEIYLLGDNEAVSVDSRRWGPVPLRLVVGKPVGVR